VPRRSTQTKGMRTSVEKRLTISRLPTNLEFKCYDFLNIFAETFTENIGVLCSNNVLLVFEKNDHNIGFKKNSKYLLTKIA
jgi:hypothetical protein